jgi:WD40 repeat protein
MPRSSITACCVLFLLAGPLRAAPPSYARDIKPFFGRYCLECHNPHDSTGGLDLQTHAALLAGGDNGSVVVPGKAEQSRIVAMVEGKAKPFMPPKKAKLHPPAAEVALLRAWVDAGARYDGATEVVLPTIKPRAPVAPPVTAVAYHPDGKVIAAGGRRGVRSFDVATGDPKWRLDGLEARVTALAFRPDSARLAVASSTPGGAHEVRLWELSAAGPGKDSLLNHPDDVVYALAFSPNGNLLAAAGYDRVIRLWDLTPGGRPEPALLKDHSDAVYGLAFSPDSKLLASAGADRAVKVWDVATSKRLYTLSESTDWAYAVAWSPNGRHLAAAGVDRSIRVWDVSAAGGRIVHSVFAHEGPITRLAYSSDGLVLYSLSDDRSAKAWDTERMVERTVYATQPDTPLSLAVRGDGKQLAIGRFDGALVLLDSASGKVTAQPLPIKPRPPVVAKVSPAAVTRGQTVNLDLEGQHLSEVREVIVSAPGATARALSGGSDEKCRIRLALPATVPAGAYSVQVKTDGGTSAPVSFTVDLFAAIDEVEPNDSPRTGQAIKLPVSIAGNIGKAGDVDCYHFDADAGQEVGAQVLTQAIGSHLEPVLELLGPDGNVVASGAGHLGGTCAKAGTYAVRIRDRDYRGGAGMHYRLHIGPIPVVTGVFPLGLERGHEGTVSLEGVYLGEKRSVKVMVPVDAAIGSRVPVSFTTPLGALMGGPSVVVGEHPAVPAGKDVVVPIPGTGDGRIESPGALQTWRFHARKGERLLLEIEARRLGSPLDSVIEILDAAGRPLPRATLRCQAKTYVTFRDHDSTGSGIRIETWNELAVNDWVLLGQELLRINALPRNPDDDCQFFADQGQRLGQLGTTPTHHPMGEPLYKVTVHPPGTTFPPNGLPVVTLYYRNDDGGPGFGKDSRLVFDPPADGDYRVRVGDARGQGSSLFAYRLTIRPPRPRFTVRFQPTTPTVWKGGGVPITVTADRVDEFDGAIAVHLEGLLLGLSAPAAIIPAGEKSTSFALYAEPTAASPPAGTPPLRLIARAMVQGKPVTQEAVGGVPKLAAAGDIVTTTEQSAVTVRPGSQVAVTVKVERRNGFTGRIPLEVRGLPHGVRVLDVGLNGILVVPEATTRTFVIFVEPWVQPMEQPFVVFARRESTGAEFAAKSVLLRITGK